MSKNHPPTTETGPTTEQKRVRAILNAAKNQDCVIQVREAFVTYEYKPYDTPEIWIERDNHTLETHTCSEDRVSKMIRRVLPEVSLISVEDSSYEE